MSVIDNIRIKGSIDELPQNIEQSVDYWRSVRKRYYPSIPVVVTIKNNPTNLTLKKNKLVVPPDFLFRNLVNTICQLCTGIKPHLPLIFMVNDSLIASDESIDNIYRLYGSNDGFVHVSIFQEPEDTDPPASNENTPPTETTITKESTVVAAS